jgi:hypothetical protein
VTHNGTGADALAEFGVDDVVCLLRRQDGVPAGAVGRVLGTFPHPFGGPTYPVVFVSHKVTVLVLRPDEIVLASDYRAAA